MDKKNKKKFYFVTKKGMRKVGNALGVMVMILIATGACAIIALAAISLIVFLFYCYEYSIAIGIMMTFLYILLFSCVVEEPIEHWYNNLAEE